MTDQELQAIEARARRCKYGPGPGESVTREDYVAQQDDIPALVAALREAREVLRDPRVQWADRFEGWRYCAVCERAQEKGHAPSCRLAAALGEDLQHQPEPEGQG